MLLATNASLLAHEISLLMTQLASLWTARMAKAEHNKAFRSHFQLLQSRSCYAKPLLSGATRKKPVAVLRHLTS
jgi:hypothetical protein